MYKSIIYLSLTIKTKPFCRTDNRSKEECQVIKVHQAAFIPKLLLQAIQVAFFKSLNVLLTSSYLKKKSLYSYFAPYRK
jgi:hypothetical protein